MPKIVIVDTNGKLKELNCRNVDEHDIHKAIKLKTKTGFSLHTSWSLNIGTDVFDILMYGKIDGKAGQENKYEFPPPVDKILFFGKCVLVNRGGELSVCDWNRVCEHLFGGFDDLVEDAEDDDDDDGDEYGELPVTTTGYAKDGFVVDSSSDTETADDEDNEEDIVTDSDDSATKHKKKPNVKPKARPKKNAPTVIKNKAAEPYVDCSEELTEESYI